MKGNSPTSRTLDTLRAGGYTAQVVEKWNQYAKVRVDLFGGIDIVACLPRVGIIGIQACAGASHAARREKCLAEPKLRKWVKSGGKLEIWSWSQRVAKDKNGQPLRNKDGGKKKVKTWQLRREELTEADFK